MALANVAVLLSGWGFKTLMIDWDLEAPGLENFFREYTDVPGIADKNGILEYLGAAQKNGKKLDWRDFVTAIKTPLSKEPIHLMPAGKRDAEYFKRLREFDISKFYEEHNGGKIIENLRNELKSEYDFILVDSRTGVTDVGGICTIQMPDMLVLLFTPTEQGLNGIKFIADSARKGQQNLPNARKRLQVLPIPTRIDSNTEFKISQEWTERFARELASYYEDWLPKGVSPIKFIEIAKLPYVPYFSYGEKLPVIEQGMGDTGGLGYAFENLAALIANGLEDSLQFMDDRDGYVVQQQFRYIAPLKTTTPLHVSPDAPIQVFIGKSHKDAEKVGPILSHLKILEHKYNLKIWDDSQLLLGDDWDKIIKEQLQTSEVVLFFVSQNFISGHYGNEVERRMAMNAKPVKRIVPIILDPSLTSSHQNYPLFAGFHGVTYSGDPQSIVEPLERLFSQIREQRNAALATIS